MKLALDLLDMRLDEYPDALVGPAVKCHGVYLKRCVADEIAARGEEGASAKALAVAIDAAIGKLGLEDPYSWLWST